MRPRQLRFRLPLHILKGSHGVGGECPAFHALGVDLARLRFGVTVDCHDLVLRAAVLREKVASGIADAVRVCATRER